MFNNIKIGKKKLVLIYIFFYPVFDMIFTLVENAGGSFPVSPNQLIRGIGMIGFFIIIKSMKNWVKVICIIIWSICGLFVQIKYFYSTSFFTDLSFTLKFIQNFVFYYAFIQLFKDKVVQFEEVIKYLIWSSYIAIFSILLSYLGIGAASYAGSSRFGVKGLFTIQSTITAYLLLILPLYYIRFKRNFTTQMIVCIIALFSIGSKTGVFGTILEIIFITFYDFKYGEKSNNRKIKYMTLGLMSVCVVPSLLIRYISYLFNLYTSNSYYYNLSAFLLSNRNDQIIAAKNGTEMIMDKSKQIFGEIFGYGYTSMSKIMSHYYSYEAIERDFYGIYYYFGIVSSILLMVLLGVIVLRLLKLNFRYKFKNIYGYVSFIIVGVGIIYGWLGGHIFYEAMNQLPFYIIASYSYIEYKQICSKNKGK